MSVTGRSALVVGISLLASACGKKGPLIYPDMLIPAAPSAVTARQSGAVVRLQFSVPEKNRTGQSISGLAGVKINRRAAESGQQTSCRSCMTDYPLFKTLYLDHLPSNTQRFGSTLIVLDGDVAAGNSYSYAIIPFTADGVDGAVARTADVRVTAPLPPPGLQIESLPTEIKLKISAEPLLTGRSIGYNLYRSSAGSTVRPYQPLNREPLTTNEFVDVTIERGVKYRYSVRALIMLPTGDVVESADSNEVQGELANDE